MAWYPIGPDFVFAPRRSDFKRLSKRNEWARQGLVNCIAIDPFDANAIYVTERPTSGGSSAFRTVDGGKSWKAIADALQSGDTNFDPNCIAVDPVDPSIIYIATWSSMQLARSDNQGDNWGAKQSVPGNVFKLIIDPSTAGTPATTVIYAATSNGIYRSASGGTTGSWTQVLPGDIRSFIAIFSLPTPLFLASVYASGVFRSTNPTAAANWTNLNTQNIGLPAHTAATTASPEGNFNRIDLAFCPRNPNRIYALLYKNQCDAMGQNCAMISSQLFTTSSSDTAWTEITMTSPPNPAYGFYCAEFAVAPNSAGDGLNDILFFGNIGMNRSTDSGRNWTSDGGSPGIWSHADHHAFEFYPPSPPAGTIPAMFIGNDGGLNRHDRFADPAFPFGAAPEEYNESVTYLPNAAGMQNLNHGKQSSAVYQYTGEPTVAALGYIGCQDTGIASSSGSLGWRGVADADGGALAVARGTDGVLIWANLGSPFATHMWKDTGDYSFPYLGAVGLGAGGPQINASANFILGLDNKCLAGIIVLDADTTLSVAIAATGSQAATPASMANIFVGSVLTIKDAAKTENVTVTAVTATTFTANFTQTHNAGVGIALNRSYVVRIDAAGVATNICQNLGTNSARVIIVARSPVNADLLACCSGNNRLWTTLSGSTANSGTVWTESTTNKPAGFFNLTAITIDNADNIYVLLSNQITTGAGPSAITSPLFKVNGGNWQHQPCTGVPTGGGFQYGCLNADPVEADTMYASYGGSIYRIVKTGANWTWEDMSTGLPGGYIYDLWLADFGTPGSPNVMMRAAIPTRGIWETSPLLRNEMPSVHLYVRDNILDQALFPRSPEGQPNPFKPAENVYHYQSVDVKVDVQTPATGGSPAFFQIEPEAAIPLNHVYFNQLNDNSQQIPSGGSVYIHTQVHNRGRVKANNVKVWAIYCNAAGGVPALNLSPSMGNAFAFWSQFTVTGDILPNLPADSPWRSVGPPVTLSGIDPANPQVASWLWTAPVLPAGVTGGHYCVAVFIHSSASPINESSMNVDEMTPRNKQVAQKNLHLVPALAPAGSGGGGGGGGGGGVPAGSVPSFIEFHHAGNEEQRYSDIVVDFSRVPHDVRMVIQFSELKSAEPLDKAATGISDIIKMPADVIQPTGFGKTIGKLLLRFVNWLLVLISKLLKVKFTPLSPPKPAPVTFMPVGFEIRGGKEAHFPGILIPHNKYIMARMYFENTGILEEGAEYRFDVLQQAGKKIIGGCTYIIPVSGRRKPPQNIFVRLRNEEGEEHETGEEEFLFVPPHVRHVVAERRKQMGKDT